MGARPDQTVLGKALSPTRIRIPNLPARSLISMKYAVSAV